MRRRMTLSVLGAALAVVVAASAAGASRYLWCEPMQEARTACCCPDLEGEHVVRAPCCELREIASVDGTRAENDGARVFVPALAAQVAELVAPAWIEPRSIRWLDRKVARAGPSERVHALHSVYLI